MANVSTHMKRKEKKRIGYTESVISINSKMRNQFTFFNVRNIFDGNGHYFVIQKPSIK